VIVNKIFQTDAKCVLTLYINVGPSVSPRLSRMDMNELATGYEASTTYFLDHYSTLSPSDLDRHKADGWSPRQVIHHMADSEAQSYARLRRLIAEPAGSSIQGYDEAAWAENATLGYTKLPVENSLAVFRAVRAASLDIIKGLKPTDLDLYGDHSVSGRYTVGDWIRIYTKHSRVHADQMMEAIGK
jgi:hypothetical protein